MKCTAKGCNIELGNKAKNVFCRKHQYHYLLYGDPLYYAHEMQKACSIDGCHNKAKTKHLCTMHYARMRSHGNVGSVEMHRTGLAKQYSSEHYSYNAMKIRCLCKSHKQYKDYGGRGIKICARWSDKLTGFENFLKDMGKRPNGCTLDRIDVNGDYCPENCRWATRKEQSRNQRNNTSVTYDGRQYTISELAQKNNLSPSVLYNRIMKYNWNLEHAVSTPVRKNKR